MLKEMSQGPALRFPRSGPGPYRLLRAGADRLIRRLEAALEDPKAAQRARLDVILRGARGTAFGDAHNLDQVRTLDEYRAAVPIRDHAGHLPWLQRVAAGERDVLTRERVQMLLETSGTTGTPKHLPVTATWARGVAEAQQLWILALLRDHPAVAQGKALTVVSPAVHARSPGKLPIGANTGRMLLAQPWWVRARYPVPYRVVTLESPEVRQYALLRFALQADLRTITTANPSTVLLLCRRLLEWQDDLARDLAGGTLRHGPARALSRRDRVALELRLRRRPVPSDWRPAALWNLATINCWKGGAASYFVSRLPDAWGADVPVREVGITASEGYFAIPLSDGDAGGVFWPLGHLMEFVREDGTLRWAWELEVGERVRLIVTTEAGLYRYDLQDTLEVVGRCANAPVFRFIGKSGRFLNATGEKVSEAQVSEAMRHAANATGQSPIGFTARLSWGEVPHITLAAEGSPDPSALAHAFERALQEINLEYASKRGTHRLAAAAPEALPEGTYLRYRAARVAAGAPEGQVKDPVLALTELEWERLAGAAEATP
jgi:hypothetical protein